ncbi:MAG: ParB N-terminal domain-containing protein [Alphaproteobacteria bacterium]
MIPVELVYVPVKRKSDLVADEIEKLAESILENGLQLPISVRADKARKRFVLVQGLKRLEATKMLGDEEIRCVIVEPRQH